VRHFVEYHVGFPEEQGQQQQQEICRTTNKLYLNSNTNVIVMSITESSFNADYSPVVPSQPRWGGGKWKRSKGMTRTRRRVYRDNETGAARGI